MMGLVSSRDQDLFSVASVGGVRGMEIHVHVLLVCYS